jgi:hypothetical protein
VAAFEEGDWAQISSEGALLGRALGEKRLEAVRAARNSKLKTQNSPGWADGIPNS